MTEISWISLWRILFFVILVAVMYLGRQILLGLFLALVISSGLEFMVNFLERRGLPRTLGVIVVFLASVLVIVITIYTIIPVLVVDINTVLVRLNKTGSASWLGSFMSFETARSANALVNRLYRQFLAGDVSPLGAFSNVVGGAALAASVIISSFYLSLHRDGVERFIRAVFPADHEEAALRIYGRARRKIGIWFRTQIMLSALMGLLVFIALVLLGVRYAFLLSVLAALFELVPFLGPILSGSAAVLSAFITSPLLALYTFLAFLVIHQVESHFLVPLLIGKNVGLHPVVVIVALLIGIEVGGFLGILISVPAAVVFQEILEDWSDKKRPRATAEA